MTPSRKLTWNLKGLLPGASTSSLFWEFKRRHRARRCLCLFVYMSCCICVVHLLIDVFILSLLAPSPRMPKDAWRAFVIPPVAALSFYNLPSKRGRFMGSRVERQAPALVITPSPLVSKTRKAAHMTSRLASPRSRGSASPSTRDSPSRIYQS